MITEDSSSILLGLMSTKSVAAEEVVKEDEEVYKASNVRCVTKQIQLGDAIYDKQLCYTR